MIVHGVLAIVVHAGTPQRQADECDGEMRLWLRAARATDNTEEKPDPAKNCVRLEPRATELGKLTLPHYVVWVKSHRHP